MTPKTRKIFMALVGAYLVYTGVSLILDVTKSTPKNMTLFVAVGGFFALFGLATVIWNIKGFLAESKKEQEEILSEGEESEPEEGKAEPVQAAPADVKVDVKVGAEAAPAGVKELKAEDAEETEEESDEEPEADEQPEDREGDE